MFNQLPQYIKILANDQKHFKITLKRVLYHHSFYSIDGYYECTEDGRLWTMSAEITVCSDDNGLLLCDYCAIFSVYTSDNGCMEGEKWMNVWMNE